MEQVHSSEENYLRTNHGDLAWVFDKVAEAAPHWPGSTEETVERAKSDCFAACIEAAKRRDKKNEVDIVIDPERAVGL